MIKVIDIPAQKKSATAEGQVTTVLGPSASGTRAEVAVSDIESGRTLRLEASDRTRVVYILEATTRG